MSGLVACPAADPPAAEQEVETLPASQSVAVVPRTRAVEPSLVERLMREPQRFSFDAAIMVLVQAAGQDVGRAVRFHAPVGLAFPAADVLTVQRHATGFHATVSPIGLTGPSGVLPRPYSDLVVSEQRKRSPALGAFLDLLAQRPIGLFAEAGFKYRPNRVAAAAALSKTAEARDPVTAVLLALCGYGTPGLLSRLGIEPDPIAHFSGHFATHPRSAVRLQAIVTDWLGQPVEIEQFAGMWLPLRDEERSALPVTLPNGQTAPSFNQLGSDAAAGARCWDVQSRIVLRIGPLSLQGFRALLPSGRLLQRLVALVRAFLGFETAFAVNPVLAREAVPPLVMTATGGPRLGWDTWMPYHGPRPEDAAEAVFEADLVERMGH
ncbi:type VI secretion system baseplate subunit TssG [Acidisoma cladoniae]|jgi:type VI secretion system protein ImpH|uniref:type VI secretion system baseplate subunit TssG n=1 Tax=Acidisoma cladoniae TaxID=3040935 RepID=UPI00254FEAE3|nr:type VI secretion system baseplate subunit TssG [Acidisoma sp. PAMC 29798]